MGQIPTMLRYIIFTIAIALSLSITKASSQAVKSNSFYAELGTGTAFIRGGLSKSILTPNLSIKTGYNIHVTKQYNLDIGIKYSKITTADEWNFLSSPGTLIFENKLDYLQLQVLSKLDLKKLSLGIGMGAYITVDQYSEVISPANSTVIQSYNTFQYYQEKIGYRDIGLSAMYQVGFSIRSNLALNILHNFLFIEGRSPLSNGNLRYLVLHELTLGLSFYFSK